VHEEGTGLEYCGYIGGSSLDQGMGIAINDSGIAWVCGATQSDEASFPVKIGPDLTYNDDGEHRDAFVAKVKADGTELLYCGYIGGADYDFAQRIATDSNGNAYLTGSTYSDESTFPVAVGPDLTFNWSGMDPYLAIVSEDGSHLHYCGYIGEGYGFGIAVDVEGKAYITGFTWISEIDFPVTVGPDLTYNGGQDGFIACIGDLEYSDLKVLPEDLNIPSYSVENQNYPLGVSVLNYGKAAAPSGSDLQYFVWGPSDPDWILLDTLEIAELPPGDTTYKEISWTPQEPGSYQFKVVVDCFDELISGIIAHFNGV